MNQCFLRFLAFGRTSSVISGISQPIFSSMISRRVRQLNSGGGGLSRPLVTDVGNLSASDIALREILEEKIGWEMPEPVELVRPAAKKRRKR